MSRTPLHLLLALALACVVTFVGAAPSYASGELEDPTKPPDASETEGLVVPTPVDAPYLLSAILVAEGRRIAVINGKPVQTGDRVMNAMVLDILRDRVVLREPAGDLTLRLVSGSIRISEGAAQ